MSNSVEPEFQKELQRKELKIEHYRQKCAELQEANADLRVELTVVSQELQAAHQQLEELKAANATVQEEAPTDESN